MSDDASLHSIIERVRRQTTNRDILDICDALSRRLVGQKLIDAARGRDDAVKAKRKKVRTK